MDSALNIMVVFLINIKCKITFKIKLKAKTNMFKTCAVGSVSLSLSDTQECLESSLIEKENTLALTSEKLELINSLRENLREKEIDLKDVSDKLLYAEHNVSIHTQRMGGGEHCGV